MELVNQVFIMLPIIIMLWYTLLYLYTSDNIWIILILLTLISSAINEQVLKNIIKQARPSVRGGKYGCHTYSYGKSNQSYGMPSGHAASIAIFCIAMIDQMGSEKVGEKIILSILCILGVLHRVYIGCHTILQVICGSIFGVFMYVLMSKILIRLTA